uniref:Gag protein n=1 Tax=Panta errantivirus TaxID=3078412 RepID=A0AB38Z1R2_9VIRU
MIADRKNKRYQLFDSHRMSTPTGQPINTMDFEDFMRIGKVPDYVRDLPVFEGRASELMSWVMEVEKILHMYASLPRDSMLYHVVEGTIRRKIKGEAADVLNSNGVTGDWSSIKSTLLLYYKDKRELKTLDHELGGIRKRATESLSSYFSRVNDLLSAIVTQIYTDTKYAINAEAHVSFFKDKALDCFIRGLDSPLCFLLKNNNPPNLHAAYNYCLEYCNMNVRSAPFKGEIRINQVPKPRDLYAAPPPRPNYNQNSVPQRPPLPQKNPQQGNFMPPQQSQHRQDSHPHRQNNYPVPMEVDPSLRSNVLNYANRPHNNYGQHTPPSTQRRQTYAVDASMQYHSDHQDYPHHQDYSYPQDYSYHQAPGEYNLTEQPHLQNYPADAPLQYVQAAPPLNETELCNTNPTNHDNDEAHFLDWTARW